MKHFDYNAELLVTLILVLILSIFIIGFCRTYFSFYSKFPNVFVVPILLRSILWKEKPKETPANCFYFQVILNLVRERQRDGFCILWLHKPFLVVNNAEAIKFFSSEPSAAYVPPLYDLFKEVIGTTLLTSNGTLHKKHRKMLDPVFKISALKDNIHNLNKNSKLLVESLSRLPIGTSVAILEYLQIAAFSNIFEFLSNIDCSDPERHEEMRSCMLYVDKASAMMNHRILHPWLLPKFTRQLFQEGRDFLKETEKGERLGRKLLQDLIDSSQTKIIEGTDSSQKDDHRQNFGELTLEYMSKDPSFTLEHMKNHFYSLLIAGYDTISHTTMWCLFMLGHNPEIQDKVYNELQAVMLNDKLSYEDLQSLKYTECVLKETNRLFPAFPLYARHLQKTVKFGKYTIPKGTSLAFIPFLCHKDPEFFPNSDKFEPERFLENNDTSQWPFIAFAEGARSCIGKKFAYIQLKVLLAHIIKNFKVTSVENIEDVKLSWQIFLKTVNPLHVRLNPR